MQNGNQTMATCKGSSPCCIRTKCWLRPLKWVLSLAIVMAAGNWIVVSQMLWKNYDRAVACLASPAWPLNRGVMSLDVFKLQPGTNEPLNMVSTRLVVYDDLFAVACTSPANKIRVELYRAKGVHLCAPAS